MKRFFSLLVVFMTILAMVTACGTPTATSNEKPGEATFDYNITLYTGSMGGSYYTIGTAMSEIFSSKIDGTTISAASAATQDNIGMLIGGEAQMAMAGAPDYMEVTGGNPMDSTDICSVGVFNQLASVIIVPEKSNYQSLEDLLGKKIGLGVAGSGQCIFNLALIEALGYTVDDFRVEYLSQGDASTALVEGKLDACFVFASLPASAITQITASEKVRIIQLDDEFMESFSSQYPYYKIASVEPSMVPDCGISSPYNTLTQYGELLVNADLEEDFVYTVAKTLYENYDELINSAPGASVCTAENSVSYSSFNLHPGAQRYFKEIDLL